MNKPINRTQAKPAPAAQQSAIVRQSPPRRYSFGIGDVLTRLGRLFPNIVLSKVASMLRYAGDEREPDEWLGSAFASILAGSIAGAVIVAWLLPSSKVGTLYSLAAGMGFFLVFAIAAASTYYLGLFYAGFNRAKSIEMCLPDFFLLMASGLNSGLAPFAAFKAAARPEFGALEQEVRFACARASSSVSIAQALGQLSSGIDSRPAQRALTFLQKGIQNGGRLAKLLESTSAEMRRQQELSYELVSSTRSQSIFLFFVVALVMPFLLAIALNFVDAVGSIRSAQAGAETIGVLPFGSGVSISSSFAFWFAIVFLGITALLSSLLTGIISTGRAAYGAKYFPLVLAASVAVFLLAGKMIAGLVSGLS